MGVPAFFRWLSRKYPSIVVHSVEEKPREVNDTKIPVDTSKANPNNVEFDNLYLDMNGIIHPCCHPENKPAPKNEDEMMVAIFEYIDRIFSIVRPRKILYMAIDGVAPRAKMNQQRSRRFRASKETKDKIDDMARYREEILQKGAALPPVKEKTEHFDSNCITPGTEFMDNLSVALRYYIADRLNHDPGWSNIKVILSDANVPGEGEHKIMDFIRKQRANPSHDPNTHHCLNGADADLIMLGLATHEPHFTILREEFKPNQKRPCDLCGQVGHEFKDCVGLPKEKQGEFDELEKPVGEEVNFIFIRLNVLREYLERELKMEGLPFPYDFERSLDDWVFMCFFVGNDFLPHLPSLEIREGAIDKLITLYKKCLPVTGGYLTENGFVNLKGVHKILRDLGEMEDMIFKQRQQRELQFRRREKEKKLQQQGRQNNRDGPRWTPSGQFSPQSINSTPSPIVSPRQEAFQMRMQANNQANNQANFSAAANLKAMLVDDKSKDNNSPGTPTTSSDPNAKDEDGYPPDSIRLWEDGWRERYYLQKFDVSSDDECYDDFRSKVASAYVEGLCWVLRYYYQGCCSWKWYFPYHYAPFASDFKNIDNNRYDFEMGTQPFNPLEQLMSVFPAASGNFLPPTWRELMMNPESPIIDFYPVDFNVDLNGKKYAWQGVALLPFVDEKRLLVCLAKVYPDLSEEERRRNSRGKDRLFIASKHPAFDFLKGLYEGGGTNDAVDLVTDLTQGMSGKVMVDDQAILPNKCVSSPIPHLRDLTHNLTIGIKFEDIKYGEDYVFKARLLPTVSMPGRVLKPEDWNNRQPYRPVIGFSPNTPRASLDMASRRMLGFHMRSGGASTSRWEQGNNRDPRRNSYPPPAHVTAYGSQRQPSPGPWPRQKPSHYGNSPGGHSPYQRDQQRDYQQRHPGNQYNNQSYSEPRRNNQGYTDPRRRSTGSLDANNSDGFRRPNDGRNYQDSTPRRYRPY